MKMVSQHVVVAALAAAVGLLIGGLIGHFGTQTTTSQDQEKISMMEKLVADKWVQEEHLNQRIIDLVDTDNLRNNLKELTRKPHLAGTPRDDELARLVQERFLQAGFDTADLVPYNLLLSRPDFDNPNLVTLQDGTGTIVFTSTYSEKPLQADDDDPNFVLAFSGYAPAGDVSSAKGMGVIYVNYGRVEDFDKLEEFGVNVSGSIVIARYGKIFRGNKLAHAQERGAKGVILFSDPEDVAQEGVEPQKVYPNTWWLPGSGIQRGTTFIGNGDPLTPGWPSTEHAYRLKVEEADLPKIPCQPIGYDDAKVILEKMGGKAAPDEWKGGITGINYNLGPDFLPQYSEYTLRLQTHNSLKDYRSYNVIGIIKGNVEPDRYVLVGNHRDSWGYGASDPSSGTAQLLETARVFGQLMKEGWRPRRTLVFCSWGAEEYALIGSTEWVEEHVDKLQERSVMYLNTDTCASGPIFNARASPLLRDPILKISKLVPGVRDGPTLYDEWAAYHAVRNKTTPEVKTLGSGSDYVPFSFYCGIPCMDIWFRVDKNKHDISTYPSYHTGYETFYMIDKNVDPGFRIIQGCSRVASLFLKYFADSAIIPYSLEHFPRTMKKALKKLKANGNTQKLLDIYDKFPILEESLDNFTDVVTVFAHNLKTIQDDLNPVTLRAINDQIMKLEQAFILPKGLPGRPDVRHAVFASGQFDSYSSSGFPGISDLLYNMDKLNSTETKIREKEIRRHISDLTIIVQRATSLLKEFHFI